jgi:hypothetical protein
MSGGEVRQLPGSFGDAFRAIEALPGVIPILSGLPYFLIRGAPPGNTGFFIDGVRVPALFHLGVGAAVIHPGLIDRVDLEAGGYPARFGRFTGGILTGETLPPRDRLSGEASVRLLDVGGLVSAPLGEDGRGDVLASGRYGYPGPLLSAFAPDTGLAYWDYQTRAHWRTNDRDDISAFVFGSYDSVSIRNTTTKQMQEVLGLQFHRVDLRFDHQTSDTGRLRVALTLGYDRSATGSTGNSPSLSFIENGTVGLRAEWTDRTSHGEDLRAGADAFVDPYHVVVPSQSPVNGESVGLRNADFYQTDFVSGVYGELTWHPGPRIELRPGARLDVFASSAPDQQGTPLSGSGGARTVPAFDPRLAGRWELSNDVAWFATLGVAHQASNIPLPSPGLQFSQLARGLQSAYQYSTGAEVKLPAQFTATADVFLHDYTGLADYIETCPGSQLTCNFAGRAIGVEILVRRALTKRLTGWFSYTLSRVERDAFYLGRWMRRLSEFDRTHVANAVVAADIGAGWRAGGRVVAYSGLPYSSFTGMVGPPDTREPPFIRLDLRVEKKWHALGGSLSLVFEWLNALLNKEAFGTSCVYDSFPNQTQTTQYCEPSLVGPITFPSIGVEGAW